MEKKYKIGIIGATGMVGQRFITLLYDHLLDIDPLEMDLDCLGTHSCVECLFAELAYGFSVCHFIDDDMEWISTAWLIGITS